MHARRSRFLTSSAIGACAAALLLAAPAQAQLTPTASTASGSTPVIGGTPTNTIVTLNSDRTVIDWSQFDIASGDRADFVFANNAQIVLNRVSGAASTIDGTLNGCLTNCDPGFTPGGNLWVYNSNGVVFGGNARVNVGGMLVTTAALDDATSGGAGGFLNPATDAFTFGGAIDDSAITIQNGAQINATRGALAFVAPIVRAEAGSAVTGTDGADVLYGSASGYIVSFARTGADDYDLLSFEVGSDADGAGGSGVGVTLEGTTSANRIYVAAVSKLGVTSDIIARGTITATTASGQNGDIVLSAGSGIAGGAPQAAVGDIANIAIDTNASLEGTSLTAVASNAISLAGSTTTSGATTLTSRAGDIVQTDGVVTAASLALEAQNGASFTSANKVGSLSVTSSGGSGDVTFVNDAALDLTGLDVSTGNASVDVTTGGLTGTALIANVSGNLSLTAADAISLGALAAGGDLTVSNGTGDVTLGALSAGEDISVTATGAAAVEGVSFTAGGSDAEADGYNLLIRGTSARLGAVDAGSIGVTNLLTSGAASPIAATLDATAGAATLNLDSMDQSVDMTATGAVAAHAENSDLKLGMVIGTDVSLRSTIGTVDLAGSLGIDGDYTLYAGTGFSAAALTPGLNPVRDITITQANGDLTLADSLIAGRNLSITVSNGALLGSLMGLVAGSCSCTGGDVTVNASDISLLTVQATNISLLAGTGTVDLLIPVLAENDYTLSGSNFSDAALTPGAGAQAGTFTITASDALDANNLTITYAGDISINASGLISNGAVQSLAGSIGVSGQGVDLYSLTAAIGVTVNSGLSTLDLFSADATSGAISLTGDFITVAGYLSAGQSVLVDAQSGASAGWVTAGGDLTVQTAAGDAILRRAVLTGATGDLLVSTGDGNALLGSDDYSAIDPDHYFRRTGGGTGAASVISDSGGDATAYLADTAALTTVRGETADVTVSTGDVSIDTLTATGGDAYAEVQDGSLIVGTASAVASGFGGDGFVYLSATGTLDVTGGVTGAEVYLSTLGALDTSLITGQIHADDYLEIIGGSVTASTLSSDGDLAVTSTDTDVTIDHAAGGYISILAERNATLRSADSVGGLDLLALDGDVTFGADTVAGITAGNTLIVGACGCGGAIVGSLNGNVTVNLYSVTGGFDAIAAAIDGNALVNVLTGDLTIGQIGAYDITVSVAGTLDIWDAFISGGSYSLTAQDFLSGALNPEQTDGFDYVQLTNYSITDTAGGLAMDDAIDVSGTIAVNVQNGGALSGSAEFTAGGDVSISGTGVAFEAVSGRDISLSGFGAGVSVNSVTAARDYTLTGASFTAGALAPLGARTGAWTITSNAAFSHAGTDFAYGGNIWLNLGSSAATGAVTSSTGNVRIDAASIQTGALSATGGSVGLTALTGDIGATSASALNNITMSAGGGITLGRASFLGTSGTIFNLTAATDLIFGAATPGAIGAGNTFTSTGTAITSILAATNGSATVNLISSAELGTIQGKTGVSVQVDTGNVVFTAIRSANGAVTVRGPSGTLTVGALDAALASDVRGNGTVTLGGGTLGNNLALTSTAGDLVLGSDTLAVAGALALTAAGEISQTGSFSADSLTIQAGGTASLGSTNTLRSLGVVSLDTGGNFLLKTAGALALDGAVTLSNGTVEINTGGAITQAGGAPITATRLQGSSGAGFARFGAENQVQQLGTFSSGGMLLNNATGVTIDGLVNAAGGAVTIRSHNGMLITATGSVRSDAGGDAVVLASDGAFTNQGGAAAVQAANGRWLIYTQAYGSPSVGTVTDFTGLTGKSFYGSVYNFTTGAFAVAPNAGNRFVYGYRPVLTVDAGSVVTTYDGAIPTIVPGISGLVNGDLAADAWSGAPIISGNTSRNAGTYTLTTALGTLASDLNYAFDLRDGSLSINPKALTASFTTDTKTYDGLANGTGIFSLSGVILGDTVAASGNVLFGNASAGTGKSSNASGIALSGADAANYTVNGSAASTGDILQKLLTVTLTADSRTYDGTTGATGTLGLTGLVSGESVSASGDLAFASKNAGSGKTVTATGITLSGITAANYLVSATTTALADIFAKALTAALTVSNKTYDGNASAAGTLGLTGVVSGDAVNVSAAGIAFADRNAGTGKTATASGIALSGADAANYTVGANAAALADIFAKALTVTLTANGKTYDGNNAATGTLAIAGLIAGDSVSATGALNFADKNAGSAKTVAASGIALAGTDAGNYTANGTATALADILRKAITVTASGDNKTYDGTTAATGHFTLAGAVAGDSVGASGSFAFANADAGAAKSINLGPIALTGADAANYSFTLAGPAFADVLRRQITVTADDLAKLSGQADPVLTYRVTFGNFIASDGFTGGLTRASGELPGTYAIGRGSLSASANYQLTFVPGVLTIRAVLSLADGSDALKYLKPKGFSLNSDPSANLEGGD